MLSRYCLALYEKIEKKVKMIKKLFLILSVIILSPLLIPMVYAERRERDGFYQFYYPLCLKRSESAD